MATGESNFSQPPFLSLLAKLYLINVSCLVLVNPFLRVLFSLFSDCVSVATLALGVWKVSVLSSWSVSSTLELFWLCVSSDSSVGCLESLRSILLVCVRYIRVVLILSVRAFCVRVSNFLVFFLSYGRGDYSILHAFLYLSSIFFLLFNFLWFIFHAFFVVWAFQLHLFNSFTVPKIYLYTMGYVFGSIRLLSLASSGLLTAASCPRFLFTIYDF